MWDDFRIAYQPDYVITDQRNVEILAIWTSFPLAKVHYCAWHVSRAWERRLTHSMLGISTTLTPNQRLEEREQVRCELHRILYTPNKDQAFALLSAFQENHRYRPEMLQFLDKNYFTERELRRRMACFRDNLTCAVVDTNNYVES
ncbi:hypothetical protein BG011_000560 [Mortierella polycephala]|uniref:MULE transposase domain-containing protein n=1 Tax=Mortierella polycephala TaxID=41804 RepID=A0A9P6TV96_9FUNG|nr:hypothetical protein BG011_000560 [Mortierella polycephala]